MTNYSHCAVIIRPPELIHPMTWKLVPLSQHLICAPSSRSGIQIEYRGYGWFVSAPLYLKPQLGRLKGGSGGGDSPVRD